MKTLVAALAAVAFTAPVEAKSNKLSFQQKLDQLCSMRAESARNFMQWRQDGSVSMKQAMASANSEDARELVIAAYGSPGYQTPENQRRAVTEFGNKAAVACHRKYGSGDYQ